MILACDYRRRASSGRQRFPEATRALKARRKVEVDARVLRQIDGSLQAITRHDPMDDMR